MSNIQFIIQYLKYKMFATSKKGHGVHSPFVFDFIEKVLNSSPDLAFENRKELLQWHKNLKNNNRTIKINEIGAGSRKKSDKEVKVGDLVRKTGISSKYGQLLGRLLNYYRPEKSN